jgi:hypothetical protein
MESFYSINQPDLITQKAIITELSIKLTVIRKRRWLDSSKLVGAGMRAKYSSIKKLGRNAMTMGYFDHINNF